MTTPAAWSELGLSAWRLLSNVARVLAEQPQCYIRCDQECRLAIQRFCRLTVIHPSLSWDDSRSLRHRTSLRCVQQPLMLFATSQRRILSLPRFIDHLETLKVRELFFRWYD